jgi:hypothetical protein
LAFLSLFLSGTQSTQAADGKTDKTTKPAWQWTLEERLAKRFDPEAMRVRAAAHAAELDAHRDKSGKLWGEDDIPEWMRHRTDVAVLKGALNPELFLPRELFIYLLMSAFPAEGYDTNEYKRMIEDRAAALGFGSDLWTRLRKVAAPVLALERKREKLARENPSAIVMKEGTEMDDDDIVLCRAQAQALAQAEAEFGKEPFLRLLYQAVTPALQTSDTLYEGVAELQSYLERGCP